MTATLAAAILLSPPPGPSHGQEMVPRIINGQPAGDLFPSVGIVGSRQRGDFCTGTLISPRHVLTVAHGARLIAEPDDGTFTVGGEVYSTARVDIHPLYDSRTGSNDIAILQLSEPVTDITPSWIFRGTPQPGDVLILVGFGAGGTATTGSDGTFGTQMYGQTVIQQVTDTLIVWQFDDSQESNTAPGDSGGPGFLWLDGQSYIASITSGGTLANAALGDIAFNTRVDAFADWIDATVADIGDGDDPGSEQPEEPEQPEDPEQPEEPEQPDEGEDPNAQPTIPGACGSGHFGRPSGRRPVPDHGAGRPGGRRPGRRPSGLFSSVRPSRGTYFSTRPQHTRHVDSPGGAYIVNGAARARRR